MREKEDNSSIHTKRQLGEDIRWDKTRERKEEREAFKGDSFFSFCLATFFYVLARSPSSWSFRANSPLVINK